MTASDNSINLGSLTASVIPVIDEAALQRTLDAVERDPRTKLQLSLGFNSRPALADLTTVREELDKLSGQSAKTSREQAAAARSLEQQYKATGAAQVASARTEAAESAARTARLREQSALMTLNGRLAAQAASEEKRRSQEGIQGLSAEVKAYRDLWQARVLSNDQVYAQQTRLRQQALEMLATTDRQTDAYRQLTQIAAAAQRTMDSSQGINTPGGFGAGVSQGITNALGQFGVTGDLIAGFVRLIAAKRAEARNTASGLGEDTMAGLIAGMKSQQVKVTTTANAAADAAAEAIRKQLDIHSPSRVMEELGRMTGLGFVVGIKAYQDDARQAAEGLAAAAAQGASVNTGRGTLPAPMAGFQSGNSPQAVATLAALNAQLAATATVSTAVAAAEEAASGAMDGLGESVSGASDQVKGLLDARKEEDTSARQVAVNEAKTAIAYAATGAALTGLVLALNTSINAAADYQQAMAGAASTTEATAVDMAKLDEVAKSRTLVDLGIGATEAAGGIEELGSQGLTTAQIIDGGLVSSLTLAKAVTTDVATAAKIAAASTKAFGLEAKDLARVGDIVTNAVNATSIKVDTFADAIAAGGAKARTSGLDFTQFTAVISFLTDKAQSAADAGTSLNSFLFALTPNSKDAAAEMHRLGFNAFDAQGNFKSLADIAENLRSSFSKLTPEQRALSSEIIFGTDGQKIYNALMEQGSQGVRDRIDLLNRQGTMDEAARKKLEGLRGEQDKFNAALENFKIAAGEGFLPIAGKMLNWATDFLSAMVDVNREYGKFLSGQAAFGAQTYDLPTWLKQTGLEKGDLTSKEVVDATRLLQLMQEAANRAAKDAEQWRKLGMEGKAASIEQESLRQIGQLGVTLTEIQRSVAGRVSPNGYTLGTYGNFESILKGLGVSGFGISPTYPGHTGRDVRTPEGTPISAGENVRVTSGFDKGGYGQYLKLIDRDGYQMILGHLKTIDAAIVAQIKEQGFAVAKAGQLLGTTGGAAGAWYSQNSTGPHLHVEVRDPQGKVQNLSRFRIGQAGDSGAGAPVGTPTGDQPVTFTDAQIKKARELQAAVDAAVKANDPKAWNTATAAMKRWEDQSKSNAAALEAVRATAERTSRSARDVTEQQIQAQIKAARTLAEEEARLKEKGTRAEREGLDARIKAFTDGGVAQREALERARRALAGEAQMREQQQRDQDRADKEAETRAQNRLKTQQALQDALARGARGDAQRALDSLKQQQQDELDLVKDNATKRQQVIEASGPAIVAAQKRIANLTRDEAVKAAQRTYDEQSKLPGANLDALEKARRATVREAYAQAKIDRAAADRDQERAEQGAAEASKARAREQAKLRAQIADEQRQMTVAAAQGAVTRLVELDRQELAAFQGTATQRLALIRRQASDEYAARERAAAAVRDKALTDARNGMAQLRKGREDAARAAYTQSVLEAGGTRDSTVRTEEDRQQKAVRDLRGEYSKLAASIRDQVLAGKFDSDAKQKALEQFNALGRAAREAGLTTEEHIAGARKSVWSLVQAGEEAQHRFDVLDLGGAIIDPATGRLLFQTEAQIKGTKKAADDATDGFFDLGRAIENVGMFSRTELEDLLVKSGLAADEADRLRAAWDELYATIDADPQLPDTLQGRGVTVDGVGSDDPALGVLAPGEKDALIARMDTMNIEDIGKMYAGLVLKGFRDSELGRLIGDYLQGQTDAITQNLLDNGGMTFDPNGNEVFQTEAQVRGQDAGSGSGEPGFYDASQIDVGQFGSMKELDDLITKAGILDDTAQKLREDWQAQNESLLSMIKGYDDAGNAIYYTDQELRNLDPSLTAVTETAQEAVDTSGDLAKAQDALTRVTRQVAQAAGESVDPWQEQLDILDELQRTNPTLTAQIVQLRNEIYRLQKQTADTAGLEKFKTSVQQVGQIVQELFSMFGANQAAQGVGELTGAVTSGIDAFGKFASGDIVGGTLAAISALGNLGKAIDDLNPAIQRQKKEWSELAAAEQQAMGQRVIGGTGGMNGIVNPYYDALKKDAEALTAKVNAGFWQRVGWALFGNAPETLSEEASKNLQMASAVFNEFGSSLYNALESALMNAFDSGDFSNVAAAVEKSLNQLVAKMYLQTLIAKSRIKDDLEQLADDQAAGRDISGSVASLRNDINDVVTQFEQGASVLPGFGAGAGNGGSSSGSMFGAGPEVQVGLGRVEVQFASDDLKGLHDLRDQVVPVMLGGFADFRLMVGEFRQLMASGRGAPALSGLGGF